MEPEAKAAFYSFEARLEKIYGKPDIKDNLMTIALWVDYWDYKSTALFLDYYFTNSSDVENTEDDVL